MIRFPAATLFLVGAIIVLLLLAACGALPARTPGGGTLPAPGGTSVGVPTLAVQTAQVRSGAGSAPAATATQPPTATPPPTVDGLGTLAAQAYQTSAAISAAQTQVAWQAAQSAAATEAARRADEWGRTATQDAASRAQADAIYSVGATAASANVTRQARVQETVAALDVIVAGYRARATAQAVERAGDRAAADDRRADQEAERRSVALNSTISGLGLLMLALGLAALFLLPGRAALALYGHWVKADNEHRQGQVVSTSAGPLVLSGEVGDMAAQHVAVPDLQVPIEADEAAPVQPAQPPRYVTRTVGGRPAPPVALYPTAEEREAREREDGRRRLAMSLLAHSHAHAMDCPDPERRAALLKVIPSAKTLGWSPDSRQAAVEYLRPWGVTTRMGRPPDGSAGGTLIPDEYPTTWDLLEAVKAGIAIAQPAAQPSPAEAEAA